MALSRSLPKKIYAPLYKLMVSRSAKHSKYYTECICTLLYECSINQLINQSTNQSIINYNQSINNSINRSIDYFINQIYSQTNKYPITLILTQPVTQTMKKFYESVLSQLMTFCSISGNTRRHASEIIRATATGRGPTGQCQRRCVKITVI
jgi:hypothetical protein